MEIGLAKSLDELCFVSGIGDIVPSLHRAVAYIQDLITPRAIVHEMSGYNVTEHRAKVLFRQGSLSSFPEDIDEDEGRLIDYLLGSMMQVHPRLELFESIKIDKITPNLVVFVFDVRGLRHHELPERFTQRSGPLVPYVHTNFQYKH